MDFNFGSDSPEQLKAMVPMVKSALIALTIFVVGWIGSKWGNRLMIGLFRRRNLDEALGRFLAGMLQYTILAATVIAALGAVGVETTSLLAVFASAGLAVGLALQGTLGNFASGVMILFFRPFQLGDVVTAGGHTGTVNDIGMFATSMTTPDNQRIIIPNSAITGGSIVNITTLGTRRGAVDVGVAYGADLKKVQEVLLEATKSLDIVLKDPEPGVAFVEMAASSLNFRIVCWCNSSDYMGMLHEVRSAAYNALNKAEIEIPFNQIVVHKAD